MDVSQPPSQSTTATNAVKLAGEAILPGASLLMQGKVAHGGAHVLAGFLAKALLGPIGVVLVIANSYSHSTTGKNLLKQFRPEDRAAPAPPGSAATPVAPVAPAAKG
jgi:hypothetical protein